MVHYLPSVGFISEKCVFLYGNMIELGIRGRSVHGMVIRKCAVLITWPKKYNLRQGAVSSTLPAASVGVLSSAV